MIIMRFDFWKPQNKFPITEITVFLGCLSPASLTRIEPVRRVLGQSISLIELHYF